MNRRNQLTATLLVASVVWASAASAADPEPTEPVVTSSPMSTQPNRLSPGGGAQPSDLPAPDTSSWVNTPLLITSSVVLVGAYVPMMIVGATSERPSDQTNLYYPVVGPWMNLADRQCDVRQCSNEGLNKAALITDGIFQGLGAIGIVTSFFLPNKATRNWYLIGNQSVHVAPTRLGVAGYGLGATGTF